MRKISKAGPIALGIAGAVLTVGLQVPPETATSNLTAWLNFFRLDGVASWIASFGPNAQVDVWATAGGMLLIATSFLLFRVIKGAEQRNMIIRVDPRYRYDQPAPDDPI
jgi:hypothetical protein